MDPSPIFKVGSVKNYLKEWSLVARFIITIKNLQAYERRKFFDLHRHEEDEGQWFDMR